MRRALAILILAALPICAQFPNNWKKNTDGTISPKNGESIKLGTSGTVLPAGVLCRSTTDVANTGGTSEVLLYSCTIPAATLGANSVFEYSALYSNSANAGTCTYYVHISNTAIAGNGVLVQTSSASAASRSLEQWGKCANRNSTSAQVCGGHNAVSTNIVGVSSATATYATATVPVYLTFSVVNSNGADTCTLQLATVTLQQQ